MNTGIAKLDARSEQRLIGVHPALVKVARHAANGIVRYIVTEGMRTAERQRELFLAGASRADGKKKISQHQLGRAFDGAVLVGEEVRWDWPLYERLAAEMKLSAAAVGVPIVWGGDWPTFKDGPHFELAASVK